MKTLLVTGLNGTLAPRLAEAARADGWRVIGWDRRATDPDDDAAARGWLAQHAPDAIAHLATGSVAWAARLAEHAATHGLPFVFTSTAMVFHHEPDGPHAVDAPRNAQDDYGRGKIAGEDAVRAANPAATIVRLGWQIDERPDAPAGTAAGRNHMLRALDEWQARDGHVAASRRWRPACSFMADTAAALAALLRAPRPGSFHFDANARDGHHFGQIVQALRQAFGRDGWVIREHDGYAHDQRLVGGGLEAPPLTERLPALRAMAPVGS